MLNTLQCILSFLLPKISIRSFILLLLLLLGFNTHALTIEENLLGYCGADGAVQNNHSGASNGSYVNLSNDAGKGVNWAVQVVQPGNYTISFRYASSGTQTATQAALRVNGVVVAHSLPFPKTGAWTSWANSSPFTISLMAGANTLRLETTVATEFANIDSMTIVGNGIAASSCSGSFSPRPGNNGSIPGAPTPSLSSIPAPSPTIDMARALPAEFDVNNNGQATYNIPILTVPGNAGLAPQVSLSYSSGAGNGIAGLGWSLNAGGSISRCRKTEGIDKNAASITWSANDRFCLNGQRLLIVTGQYGQSGSTYKTEIDNFARVTAVGGGLGHPEYFTVEYKDGMIETYGDSSDSANSKYQLSPGNSNTVLSWSLSRRSDSAGNNIIYLYITDSDGHRLNKIEYASGFSNIQFEYENRDDSVSGYVAGFAYNTKKRLKKITSYNDWQEIRRYELTYNQESAFTNRDQLSRINKIQECVGSVCAPATKFEWTLPDYQLAAVTYTKTFPNGISVYTMGDFNGDGLQDIAWLDQAVAGTYGAAGLLINRPLRYAFGKIGADGNFIFENQLFSNGSYIGPRINSRTLKAMDLNNDGRMDLAFDIERRVGYEVYGSASSLLSVPMPDGTWKLSVGPTEQKSSPPFGLPLANNTHSEVAVDVNSDGIVDGIAWLRGELPWDGEIGAGWDPTNRPYVSIVKGNLDVTTHNVEHILGDPSVKNHNSFETQPDADFRNNMDSAPINYLTQLTGDFNGDGVMDVTTYSYAMYQGCQVQDEGYRFCKSSLMLSLSAMYTLHKASDHKYELRFFPTSVSSLWDDWDLFFDANNDGLSDILARDSIGGWGLRINNGEGFGEQSAVGINFNSLKIDPNKGNHELVLADINGDGYQDIVWQNPINTSLLVGLSEIRVKYWNPHLNKFEGQDQVLGTLPYKIIENYNNAPVGTPRPDPRMINVLRFKTDRFGMSDINGDGIPDLVTTPNTQTNDSVVTVRLGFNPVTSANKIISITNGFGEKKKIYYARINDTDHYARLNGINASVNQHQICEDVIQTYADDTQYVEHMCWTETTGTVDAKKFYESIYDPWIDLTLEEQSLRPASPVLEAFGSMPVVTDVEITAPSGSRNNPQQIDTATTEKLSYYYAHAKMQAGGRGFLGFRRHTVLNRETGIRTETEYRQDWPYTGLPRNSKSYTKEGKLLSATENIWALANCYTNQGYPVASCIQSMSTALEIQGSGALGSIQPFLHHTITNSYDLRDNGASQGRLLSETTVTQVLDNKGNIVLERTLVNDGYEDLLIKNSTSDYTYTGSTWSMQQGRLHRLTVTSSDVNYGSITRTSEFEYYQVGSEVGLLKTEIVEPDNSAYTVATTHFYEAGNRIKSSVTADGQTRTQEAKYNRYLSATYELFTNGNDPDTGIRQQASSVVNYDRYGTPTEVWRYTGYGSSIKEKTATTLFGAPYFIANSSGAFTSINKGLGNDPHNLCPFDTKVWELTQQAGGGSAIQCVDVLGRIRRTGAIGFDGSSWSLIDTEYDKLGRVLRTSAPYLNNDSQRYWTATHYDVLGRPIQIDQPYQGSTVSSYIEYDGYETKYINPKGQVRTEVRNALGQITWVKDPIGGLTRFFYDARGNIKEMRDPQGNSTFMNYDLRDRKISTTDPDKGIWTYQYNRFNELVCQNNGALKTIIQRYDVRGRLFSREDRSGSNSCTNGTTVSTTRWVYDTASNGYGLLARVYIGSSNTPEYDQRFSYDRQGRLQETVTNFLGHNNVLGSHYEKTTYDQYGRVFQVFDAARNTATFENNGVEYVYSSSGYLSSIKDAVRYGNQQKAYYTVNNMDARGNVTAATYGNGATKSASFYKETGLAEHIATFSSPLSIELQYSTLVWDAVGNLSSRAETGGGTWIENYLRTRNIHETFYYDDLNRLESWSTSGDFNASESVTYDEIDNIRSKSSVGAYSYGSDCNVSHNAGPHAVCRVGTTNYNYDKTGNLINDGSGRSLQYTVFDLPSLISKGGHTTRFNYGPNRERYKRIDQAGAATTTTLYLGTVEKIYYPDSTVEWKRTIAGVAIVSQTFSQLGVQQQNKENYLHSDHLGSVSLITNSNSMVVQDFYFDPWGASRTPDFDVTQWQAAQPFLKVNKPITGRGFTGHEHLDEIGLIHMNGRIYDAKLARFVQADPIIQDPLRVQSLNRYSYVWNNPLNATDPSGFCTKATVEQDTPSPCVETGKQSNEEIVVKGEKSRQSEGFKITGLTYTITNPSAVQQWLKDNGMSHDDFDSLMQNMGISKSSTNSRAGSNSGSLIADKNGNVIGAAFNKKGAKAVVYALGEASSAAEEAQGEVGVAQKEKSWWTRNMVEPWAREVMGLDTSKYNGDYWTEEELQLITFLGSGGGAAPGSLRLANTGSALTKTDFKLGYHPRVWQRAVEDGGFHQFPLSIDKMILTSKPQVFSNGYRMYRLEGSMYGGSNLYKGHFEIGVHPSGIIDHRMFRPLNPK